MRRSGGGHPAVGRGQCDGRAAVRQIQAPAVRVPVAFLHSGQRTGGQEFEQGRSVQRRPVRQPQADRARTRPGRRAVLAQGRRRTRVHLEDRVVELPHAAETGRERDLGEAQVRRLDEDPGGLRALRPGQRERPGAQLGGEHPVQVAFGVAEPARQPRHAVAVHHPVADEPHRTADHVGPHIPLRRARRGVRPAPAAGPEAVALRGRRARVERDVLPLGRDGRAGRTAVDAGGLDGRVEPAVEPLVTAVDRPVAPLEIQLHGLESAPRRWALARGFRTSP